MVWYTITHSLVTILIISLWREVTSNLPLMSTDATPEQTEETLKQLESSLLKLLGMETKPNKARQPIKIPAFMQDLYRQQTKDLDNIPLTFQKQNTLNANTARSYSHIGTKTHSDNKNIVNLFFNTTNNLPEDETLVSAELHLYRHGNSSTFDAKQKYRLDVYEILSGQHTVEGAITRLIDTRQVTDNSWQHLDITPALQRWRRKPKNILGVQVHIRKLNGERTLDNHVRVRRDVASEEEWLEQKPFLVLYSDDVKHSRSKRGAGKRKSNRKRKYGGSKQIKTECQRREMEVDFTAVGWEDWILAPRTYKAYFCHGECPFPLAYHLNATNHAIVQTLMSEVDPEAVPKPCCVPTDLSTISILYVNGDEVVLKNYQEMAVEGCGCR